MQCHRHPTPSCHRTHFILTGVLLSCSQLKDLKEDFPDHPSSPLLEKVLTEFRDDELHHLDTAVENESQQAPAYALLSAVIAGGCRLAIEATKRV